METAVDQEADLNPNHRKRLETWAVLLLMVFLAPAIAVIVVGGYGFIIWMSQLILGPPSV